MVVMIVTIHGASSVSARTLQPPKSQVTALAILMVVQDGTSDALAAIWFGESNPEPVTSDHEGNMHLDVILPTEEGWLVGDPWQAPANWLGSNPTSPPMYELILHVTWDGVNAPAIEIVHMGNEGAIHGLFATDEGFIATGTSRYISIIDDEITSLGMQLCRSRR